MSFAVFQFRRGLSSEWASVNPTLADGELGLENNTRMFKMGDGVTTWNLLPYGGIQGLPGADAIVSLGTVSTGAAGSQASVSNSGTPQNSVLNFTIPRGDQGLTGSKGWSPVLSIVADGERRVLRLTDYLGGEGTKPSIPADNYIGAGSLTALASAVDIRGPSGSNGVTSFNGRQGAITPQVSDYDSFYTTDAQAEFIANAIVEMHASQIDAHPLSSLQQGGAVQGNILMYSEVSGNWEPAVLPPAGPQMLASVHSTTQANNTTTAADLTGQVFTLPPGKTMRIQGNLIFTAAATTTGAFYGFRVAHGAGANGNVQGSWNAEVALSSAASATGLADGDSVNVAAGATVAAGILGTGTVAGNSSAWIMLTLVNRSTNADATVALQFRSEVAGSAVTSQIGTSAVAMVG